jgi:hypothetical protein
MLKAIDGALSLCIREGFRNFLRRGFDRFWARVYVVLWFVFKIGVKYVMWNVPSSSARMANHCQVQYVMSSPMLESHGALSPCMWEGFRQNSWEGLWLLVQEDWLIWIGLYSNLFVFTIICSSCSYILVCGIVKSVESCHSLHEGHRCK